MVVLLRSHIFVIMLPSQFKRFGTPLVTASKTYSNALMVKKFILG